MTRQTRFGTVCLGTLLWACGGGETREASLGDPEESVAGFPTLELDAAYPEAFSYLSGVRELPDGRLFAADPLSQVLLRVDLASGTSDTLGRKGEGPQEYEGPDHVLPLPADSTLLVDLGNGRLVVLDPAGTFVDWIPMVRPREDGTTRTVHPRFVDDHGVLYLPAAYDLEGGAPDSTGISRFDPADNSEKVVAWAWRPERTPFSPGAKRPMLRPMDDWAVGHDGRIAVVRANGFSVDWYLPDGRILKGPACTVESFAVGEAEREAEMEEMARAAIFTSVMMGEGGVESRQMTRGLPPGAGPGIDDFEWPETLPTFRPMGTLVSPDAEAWVQRIMPAGWSSRYEVFDSVGAHLGSVDLPNQGRIIGFGTRPATRGTVYVARVDEVGLIWLERYRIRTGSNPG